MLHARSGSMGKPVLANLVNHATREILVVFSPSERSTYSCLEKPDCRLAILSGVVIFNAHQVHHPLVKLAQ